jgi:hypothetical protein
MISKFNRLGIVLLIVSTLIIILAMPARRLPLLTDFGPKDWFQYLIAMLGFLGVGAGLFIRSLVSQHNVPSDNAFTILMILGGLYAYVLGFVLVIQPRWLDLSISGIGLIGAAVGFLCFFEFHKKFVFLRRASPDFAKILLVAWMAALLVCFLLYWGAPVEFWQILDRFGVNVDDGSLLREIQKLFMIFFTYS